MRGSAGLLALMGLALGVWLAPGCGGRVSGGSSQASSESEGVGGRGTAGAMPEDVAGMVHWILVDPDAGDATTAAGGDSYAVPCNGAGPYHRCRGLPFDVSSYAGAYDDACAGSAYESEGFPSDLFILLDRSATMQLDLAGNERGSPSFAESRWDGVRAGLQEIVETGALAYAGMSLHVFGYDAAGSEALNCDPFDYLQPLVPVGQVPEVAADILARVEELTSQLGGPAPTLPALQGVIAYASQRAEETDLYHISRLVLVTSSLPTQCQETGSVEEVAAEAARGLAEDGVLTYVVGVGQGLDALHRVADAGGTCEASLIEDGEIASQLVDALQLIPWHLHTPLMCELQIAEPLDPTQQLDPDRTLVTYRPPIGSAEMIPQLESLELCDQNPNGGWAYDSTTNPETVVLCPCTCNGLSAGMLEVRHYCEPRFGSEEG